MSKLSALLAAPCLALALCLLALPGPAAAHAATRADTSGSITGTLVNGTHGNAEVAGASVMLQAVVLTKAHDAASATTDAQGHFQFTGLDTSGATTYAVYMRFHGGLFFTPAIRFDSGAAQQATLTVYDVTASDAALRVVNDTILVSKPNQAKGLLPIGEFVTFENSGKTAYVGSTAPANGLPMNLLRFALPDSATNLTLGAGFAGVQVTQVATGFGAAATLPPGQSSFAFAFAVPYAGTQYDFSYKAEYPSDHVVVLLQPDARVLPRDFTLKPAITASGQRYQVLARDQVSAGTQLRFGVTGLPLPGQDPDLDFRLLALFGAVLLLLLGGLVGIYLRRGPLADAVPFAVARRAARGHARTLRSEQRSLLAELLELDALHDAGKIANGDFTRRRDETRARLRALVLAGSDAASDPARNPADAMAEAAQPKATIPDAVSTPDGRHAATGGSQ